MINIKELYQKYEELIRYFIIGVLTTLISLGTKYGLLFTVLNAENPVELQFSVVVSWILAVTFSYFMNRKYVFKSANTKILKEMATFVGSRVSTLLMEAFLMWLFVNCFGMNSNMEVIIVTIIVQILILIGNYILSKFVVFKK